ncbi:MAG: DUF1858 domain-containing protein [Calditrichia bacterium]
MGAIRKEMPVEEIVGNHPELVRPLMEFGIKCIVCGEPLWGTLEQAAREKGVGNLDEIIVKMNRIVEAESNKTMEQKGSSR